MNMNMEKVIAGLEECIKLLNCIGTQSECKQYVTDAIALLKEQEAVKTVKTLYTDPEHFSGAYQVCPDCLYDLRYCIKEATNFCPHCGRPVKWE